MTIRVGVIGTGALGQHHVRILSDLPEAELVGIYDLSAERSAEIGARFDCAVADSFEALAGDIEAAVVAVPTVDHAEVGCKLLERGIHVLVEKPIAIDDREAAALVSAAQGRVLAVGHVEFFNPAVQALLALDLRPGFVEVHRMGVFSPRSLDIDVVLDLMIHDLQILHALDPSEVRAVHAVGVRVLSEKIDIASVRLELASGCVANLTASRVSAEKVRKLRVFSPPGYYSLDYQSQSVGGFRLEGEGPDRTLVQQDLSAPHAEPLARELEHFLAACRGEEVPLVDGTQARRALATARRVLEEMSSRDKVERRAE